MLHRSKDHLPHSTFPAALALTSHSALLLYSLGILASLCILMVEGSTSFGSFSRVTCYYHCQKYEFIIIAANRNYVIDNYVISWLVVQSEINCTSKVHS